MRPKSAARARNYDPPASVPETVVKPESAVVEKVDRTQESSPLSITLKWSLAIAALITLGMTLLGWVLIEQQTRIHRHEMELFGKTIAEQFARSTGEPLLAEDILGLEVLTNQLLESESILGIGIYNTKGELLIQAGLPRFPEHTSPERLKEKKWIDRTWRETTGRRRHAVSFYSPIEFQAVVAGYALVTLDREFLDLELQESVQTIALATLCFIVITVAMSFFLGRRLSRPITRLAAAGEAMGKGELNFPIPGKRRDEIGQIVEAFNRMAAGLLEKGQVEAALSRYVPSNVARNIVTNLEHLRLGGESVEGSVLFCDIVGYTELSETLPSNKIAELLNEYFGYIALAGRQSHGMVDKFIGDCVMVVFGVPDKDEHHGLHAVSCAALIQQLVERLNVHRREKGRQLVRFRIGISSGEMLAGNMGAEDHMQYTVVGDTVNLAARLCPLADAGGIIISQQTAKQLGVHEYVNLLKMLPIQLRGRREPVTPYIVRSLNDRIQVGVDGLLNGILTHG